MGDDTSTAGTDSGGPAIRKADGGRRSGTAVWYFVGGTFLLGPLSFLGDLGWARYLTMAAGAVVLAAGFVVLARELRARPDGDGSDPDEPSAQPPAS